MLGGWAIKAGMASLQVKLCFAISKRCKKMHWYLKVLYKIQMSRFTYLLLLYTHTHTLDRVLYMDH